MKSGKATSADSLSVEILEAFEDYENEKITKFLHEFYETGQTSSDMSTSVFIAISKKSGEQSVNCIKLSFISQIIKIILRTIIMSEE